MSTRSNLRSPAALLLLSLQSIAAPMPSAGQETHSPLETLLQFAERTAESFSAERAPTGPTFLLLSEEAWSVSAASLFTDSEEMGTHGVRLVEDYLEVLPEGGRTKSIKEDGLLVWISSIQHSEKAVGGNSGPEVRVILAIYQTTRRPEKLPQVDFSSWEVVMMRESEYSDSWVITRAVKRGGT